MTTVARVPVREIHVLAERAFPVAVDASYGRPSSSCALPTWRWHRLCLGRLAAVAGLARGEVHVVAEGAGPIAVHSCDGSAATSLWWSLRRLGSLASVAHHAAREIDVVAREASPIAIHTCHRGSAAATPRRRLLGLRRLDVEVTESDLLLSRCLASVATRAAGEVHVVAQWTGPIAIHPRDGASFWSLRRLPNWFWWLLRGLATVAMRPRCKIHVVALEASPVPVHSCYWWAAASAATSGGRLWRREFRRLAPVAIFTGGEIDVVAQIALPVAVDACDGRATAAWRRALLGLRCLAPVARVPRSKIDVVAHRTSPIAVDADHGRTPTLLRHLLWRRCKMDYGRRLVGGCSRRLEDLLRLRRLAPIASSPAREIHVAAAWTGPISVDASDGSTPSCSRRRP